MARLSADEVSAAKHIPIETVVAPVVKLNGQGFGLCPFHEERSPSFHIHRKRNRFKCFGCDAGGDVIAFVQLMRNVDFCSAVQILLGTADGRLTARGNDGHFAARLTADQQVREFVTNEPSRTQGYLSEYVQRLWDDADAPSVAEFYLDSRGIRVRPKPLPRAIRGTRRCWCSETHQYRPALLAAVSGDDSIVAVQRIWTEPVYASDDPKGAKAKLETPKKTIGRMGHGAVKLAWPMVTIGIAEGVETAMSAEILFRMPVWAALGAQRMGSIALPEVVKRVIVFGDNGEAGHKAAQAAANEYSRRGYNAERVFPEPVYSDFNEQLAAP